MSSDFSKSLKLEHIRAAYFQLVFLIAEDLSSGNLFLSKLTDTADVANM